jgi:hypothetical protein
MDTDEGERFELAVKAEANRDLGHLQ